MYIMTIQEIDKLFDKAETNIRYKNLPDDLKQHVYIRVYAQKRIPGVPKQTNNNETKILYQFLETQEFLQRNKHRFEYITALHQVRFFGYHVWLQTAKACNEPVNIINKYKIDIITSKRMITKTNNAIKKLQLKIDSEMFPGENDLVILEKLNSKVIEYKTKREAIENKLKHYNT